MADSALDNEIARLHEVLGAIRLVRRVHASSSPGKEKIEELLGLASRGV